MHTRVHVLIVMKHCSICFNSHIGQCHTGINCYFQLQYYYWNSCLDR